MKKDLLAALLCALVLLVWGFVSWTLLPWHNTVANKFDSEATVAEVLKQNAPRAGIYYLPFAQEDHKPGETAAFVNVLPDGLDMSMGGMMGRAVVGQFVAALLVLLLLRNTSNLGYWERIGFVALVGVVIGFASHFPYWNWFGFSTDYVLVTIVDSAIAWTLAGLVMARFVKGKTTW